MGATSMYQYLFNAEEREKRFAEYDERDKAFQSERDKGIQSVDPYNVAAFNNRDRDLLKKDQITREYQSKVANPENLTEERIYDLIRRGITPDANYGLDLANYNASQAKDQAAYRKTSTAERDAQLDTQTDQARQARTGSGGGGNASASEGNKLGLNQNQIAGLKSLLGA